MLTLFFIGLQLAFGVFFFYLCLAFITGAPFVPSTGKTSQKMIELAQIKKGQKVYDLGSGEGRLLFLAARKGATAVGLEINPLLVIFTALKIFFSPYRGQIQVKWQNFWKARFNDADVVFIYLLPWRMEQLKQFLLQELRPGTLVISNSFIFPDWKLLRQNQETHVYVFKILKSQLDTNRKTAKLKLSSR